MNTMTKVGSTLYIDDNGAVVCAKHAGYELRGAIIIEPLETIYFTTLGTWMVAGARDYLAFKDATGLILTCEGCN
jgi:hypothetical protein